MSARVSSGLPPARSTGRVRERRGRSRRRLLISLLAFLVLVAGALIYVSWRPTFRISRVQVFGVPSSFRDYAHTAMQGSYIGIVPRDSTFFIPVHRIRTDIISAHPEVAALSFFRSGFSGLTIRIVERTPVGRWCGLAPTPDVTPYCYLYDPNGFIYAAVPDPLDPQATTTQSQTLNPFALYAPLVGDTEEPLRATITHASQLPDTFSLARQLSSFGSKATTLVVRDDECDIRLASGTRVTYLIGHEEDAFAALTSARDNLNLVSGSLDYVDLRFPGKVYTKKKGE